MILEIECKLITLGNFGKEKDIEVFKRVAGKALIILIYSNYPPTLIDNLTMVLNAGAKGRHYFSIVHCICKGSCLNNRQQMYGNIIRKKPDKLGLS